MNTAVAPTVKKLVGLQLSCMTPQELIVLSGYGSLCIFKACYAGSIADRNGPEVLASASWDAIAGAKFETSFMTILTRHLEKLNGAPMSVAQIDAAIYREGCANNNE